MTKGDTQYYIVSLEFLIRKFFITQVSRNLLAVVNNMILILKKKGFIVYFFDFNYHNRAENSRMFGKMNVCFLILHVCNDLGSFNTVCIYIGTIEDGKRGIASVCTLLGNQLQHLPKLICDGRLAIYYLNAVSKGYQQANLDLKRKMQMVSVSSHITWIGAINIITHFLLIFVETLGPRWGEES